MIIEGRECNLQEELKKGNELYDQMKKAVESNDLEPTAFVLSPYEWNCCKRVLFQSKYYYGAADSVPNKFRTYVGTYKGVPIFVTKEV